MYQLRNGKIRRSASEWQELISKFESSKMSQSEFIKEHNIAQSTFNKWKKRLQRSKSSFVEVKSTAGKEPEHRMELELPGVSDLEASLMCMVHRDPFTFRSCRSRK